ncbi:caspase, EACC1-associated type [Actinoplanes regularis]|uniref:Caspase domain-containing protein n=1 Tax=Actinoplanes regularis TaxID=52697 RepID=A0A238Y4C1_9ACTN|nr:caspase family protein [Actinoplanes regularis]GIE86222.1 hypothetical protein Are01nite_27020 [Actinoplanes regularis]SNR65641.1 Caspase domain-containing protein [Actinoplanes regularis]
MARQPDPEASRAVLVGVSSYDTPTMTPLPTVANNTEQMAALLTDPRMWGLSEKHCTVLNNPRHPGKVLDALITAVEEATDAVVFYFAGHGWVQPDSDDLFLALPKSGRHRWWHALPYQDIRRILSEVTRPATKIVLLDCCYSGAAINKMAGESEIGDQVAIHGTYVMTATSGTIRATFRPEADLTDFTGAFIEAARSGIPDGPSLVGLPLLHNQVRDKLARLNRPIPQQRMTGQGGEVALLHNAYYFNDRDVHAADLIRREIGLTPREREVVVAPPTQVCAALREPHDEAAADRIRQAIGLTRAEQGVAAVVEQLTGARMVEYARAVLLAAIQRPPDSVVILLSALQKTDQLRWADHLVSTYARNREPFWVGALAQRLHVEGDAEAHRSLEGLIEEALLSRAGDAGDLHAMTVTLLGRDLGKRVEETLWRIQAGLPGSRVEGLADALRAAGHETVAYRLYGSIADLVADRPVTATVRLIAGMHRTGRDQDAHDLLVRLAGRHQEPQQRAQLLDVLWGAQVPAGPAEDLTHFDEDTLLATVLALYPLGRYRRGRQLMVAALADRDPQATVRFALALQRAGYPVESQGLVEQLRGDPTHRIVAVVAGFVAAGKPEYAERLVREAFTAELLTELPAELRRYAEPALGEKAVPERVELAAALPPEAGMWLLATLPDDVDAALLHDPRVALGVLGLGGARRERLMALPPGIRWPLTVIEDALSGRFGHPGARLADVLALAEASSERMLVESVIRRPVADIVALIPAGRRILDAVAGGADPRTQLEILRHLDEDDPAAAGYLKRLRATLAEPRCCALVTTLHQAGLHRHAATLLGRRVDAAWRPEAQIVAGVLSDLPPQPPSARHLIRAGLPPRATALHVARPAIAIRAAFAVFTDTELIHVSRDGTRVRVPYRRLATVTVRAVSRTTARLTADGENHDLRVRADEFARLVVRIHENLHTFRRTVDDLV